MLCDYETFYFERVAIDCLALDSEVEGAGAPRQGGERHLWRLRILYSTTQLDEAGEGPYKLPIS